MPDWAALFPRSRVHLAQGLHLCGLVLFGVTGELLEGKSGTVLLALKTGAPVIPASSWREPDGSQPHPHFRGDIFGVFR